MYQYRWSCMQGGIMEKKLKSGVMMILCGVLLVSACKKENGNGLLQSLLLVDWSGKKITVFSLPVLSINGVIHEVDHTISITVPHETDVTALAPAITYTGSRISPASGTVQNFQFPVAYTVTALDQSTQIYTVTVVKGASVTTDAIVGNIDYTKYLAGVYARGGGNVTSEGDSAVTGRGLCWNTAGSPTIGDSYTADGSGGAGAFTNIGMIPLYMNTIYHVRAYATNTQGTVYGNEITFNSGWTYGTDRAGGYVFYNDGEGGGLVSAKVNATSRSWSNITATAVGTTGFDVGTGPSNTASIMAQPGHTGSAALVCSDYSDGIYSDWFLPSMDELNLMYSHLKQNGYGGFLDCHYWSSTEQDATQAWWRSFGTDGMNYSDKSMNRCIRAVRAF